MSSLRTLIPPKIASADAVSGSADAKRLQSLVGYYQRLPKGPVKQQQPGLSPFARYYHKHFTRGRETIAPYLHFAVIMVGFGYTLHVLKHNREHAAHGH